MNEFVRSNGVRYDESCESKMMPVTENRTSLVEKAQAIHKTLEKMSDTVKSINAVLFGANPGDMCVAEPCSLMENLCIDESLARELLIELEKIKEML